MSICNGRKTDVPQTDEEIFAMVKSLEDRIASLAKSREAWITLWALKHNSEYYSFPSSTLNVAVAPKKVIPSQHEYVQLFNPARKLWVKLDKTIGGVIASRKTKFPNVPVAPKENE